MSLPMDILASRLRNELAICSRHLRYPIGTSADSFSKFPVEMEIEFKRIPGLVWEGGRVVTRYEHRFSMIVSREYPFEKPLVIWKTPIFHPNIMMPEDGGHLCAKLLDDWSFNSTLLSFIKGIESLLLNPNPFSPFGSETCTAAAAYFNKAKLKPPPVICPPAPKVVRGD